MPTLDAQGHLPQELLDREEGPSWKQAAIECGVGADHVQARGWASETVAALRDELIAVVDRYAAALGKELEMMPWSEREDITDAAREVSHVFGQFMAAAEEARALIDGSQR